MIKDIGLQGVSPNLPHKNKTDHKHYSAYYNDKTKEIIAEVFREDVDKFNYSFEHIKNENQNHNPITKLKI